MNTMMTMSDAGSIQLDEQTRWFARNPSCSVETDDRTDDCIKLALLLSAIDVYDYDTEFDEELFRAAIRVGMENWFAEVSA